MGKGASINGFNGRGNVDFGASRIGITVVSLSAGNLGVASHDLLGIASGFGHAIDEQYKLGSGSNLLRNENLLGSS